jgi:hypothetical protein
VARGAIAPGGVSLFGRCPSQETLSALSAKALPERIARHLLRCERCREVFEQNCGDEALLRVLREASAEDDLDERARRRLLELCQRVERETEG